MLTELFYDVLQTQFNNFILLDKATPQRLQKLVGKLVKIEFQTINFSFYLHFSSEKIYLLRETLALPDVILAATPLTFLRIWQKNLQGKTTLDKDLTITGNVEVAQQVNALFQELDIDWEAQFANCFGDLITHHVSKALHSVKNWFSDTKNTLQNNITEYLQEEKQLLPTKMETDDLLIDIDKLRDDVARSELRLARLEANYKN